jgi:hypothetical protein
MAEKSPGDITRRGYAAHKKTPLPFGSGVHQRDM